MAARVRNLVHRSGVMASVGGATFALTFGLLLWFTRAEREALQRVPVAADTLDLARQAASMRRLQFRADSSLAALLPPRRYAVRSAVLPDSGLPVADSATTDSVDAAVPTEAPGAPQQSVVVPIPDSIRVAAAALSARLQRAQNAPLAASWRALAADPMLQQDGRVRVLADSLADAERTRNEYDAVGGVDPIYLELSSRVTAFGRAIERVAVQRIVTLLRPSLGQSAVTPLSTGPTADELARRFVADSARYVIARARRDAAARLADSVARVLGVRRTEATARDSMRVRAQRRVEALAPPLAMLSASTAAAFGLALCVTLLLEVRAPRLADDREVALHARVPVLLSVRLTDSATPDALTSAFSQLVFDLERLLATTRSLIVVSDDGDLASRTGARIAERLGYDGRSVRVVSARQGTARMTTRSRRRATPTATQAVLVQPERSQGVAWTGEFFLAPVGGDTISIRAGTVEDVRAALTAREPQTQVVLVVRIGSTPTGWLARVRAEIQGAHGLPALGVVIWAPDVDDADPIQFALDTALQRAIDATPLPTR